MAGSQEILDKICCDCMTRSPLFRGLTEPEMNLISRNKTTISYRKGEIIRKQGTHLTHVVSIHTGFAKVYLEGPDKHNTILRIVKPTNFIGGPGIYFDRIHHYTISALTDSVVCLIDTAVFKDLIDSNKEFAHLFMEDFSRNILSVYNRLVYLTQKQMPGRMADALFYLFEEVFESDCFSMDIRKQDIADLSGMSKDSAVKILRQFLKEGIIHYNEDKMILLRRDALERISRTG
jgi:CRP/FNR family transcriptional regulator, polysaccharide utilization system transcription regulator